MGKQTSNQGGAADIFKLLDEAQELKAGYEAQFAELNAAFQEKITPLRAKLKGYEAELAAIPGKIEEAVRERNRAKVVKLRERFDYLPLEIAWAKEQIGEVEFIHGEALKDAAAAYRTSAAAANKKADAILSEVYNAKFGINRVYEQAVERAGFAQDLINSGAKKYQAAQEEATSAGAALTDRSSGSTLQARPSLMMSGSNG